MKGHTRNTRKRSYTKKRKCIFNRLKKSRKAQRQQKQKGSGGIAYESNMLSVPGHPTIRLKELKELQGDTESFDAAA
jgi:hypothetical protein